ncbi:MAG: HRDC domain-containing protein [Ignavibacteriales bacterium]|nr:HRDC domain-containing protein [Ignavibacteriales bacterium]
MINNLKQKVIFTFDKFGTINFLLRQENLPVLIITENSDIAQELGKKLTTQKLNPINLVKNIPFTERIFIKNNIPKQKSDVIICDNFSMKLFVDSVKLIIFYDNYFSLNDYFDYLRSPNTNCEQFNIYILVNPIENIKYYLILNNVVNIRIITDVYNLLYDYQEVALGSKSDKEIYANNELFNFFRKRNISEKIFLNALSILENFNYFQTNINKDNRPIKILCDNSNITDYFHDEKLRELFSYLLSKDKNSKNIEINFTELQDKILISREKLIEQLNKLAKWGFIELSEIEKLKEIRLLDARIHPRYLQIDLTDEKKKVEGIRGQFQILNEFLFTSKCRNNYINRLSDNENLAKCMKCDNCTEKIDTKKIFNFLVCSKIIETVCSSQNSITQKEIFEAVSTDYLIKKFITENPNIDLKNILQEEIKNNLEFLFSKNVLLNFEDKIYLIKREKEKELTLRKSQVKDKSNLGDIALFHKLNTIRKTAAKKYTQTEELICSDKILIEITSQCPITPSELFKIDGFTQRMFNKVGEDILKTTKEYKFNQVTDKNIPTELKQILELVTERKNLKQIAKTQNLSETFLSFQIEVLLRFRPDIDISNLINDEELAHIKNEYEKGNAELNSIYEALENKINKNKIRIALAKILFS